MANPLGRISGQLLKDNLTRKGQDLQFDTGLLYLNVNQRFIGANTDTPFRPLTVDGTTNTTNLIVDNQFNNTSNDLIFTAGQIESLSGNINLVGSNLVYTLNARTSDLNIDDNVISTLSSNSNIELKPTGSLDIHANTNVTGDIYATGDLTIDGSIIFGSNDNDTVDFSADINSDIIPDQDGQFSIGRSNRLWSELHTSLLNGAQVTTGGVSLPSGLNVALRPGKVWFVSTNGSNTNQGNHENGPFATIGHALSQSTAGDEIYIYPGTYEEIFPLTVPVGVTVKGLSLRSVTVTPTVGTNTNNAFLLNGETTVSDITVSGFYQGYAFSFAPGAKVTTRSPYVQNVSVITRGSVITSTDPLGFDSADAGKGALVDGSVCDPTTKEASMLFHSVTFITPNVDALVMTNGVRVEWLNSFTYYANRSLYALEGTLGLASNGLRFGAEIRSIASASVYGNYGAVADGPNTLMYLIQYNFAYIGSGKDSSNDNTLYIESNNVTELNSGKIVYQSVDQKGKFKVGDAFYVDFETGTTSINVSGADITGLSSILIKTGTEETFIDATKLDTGNLRVSGNTLSSKIGPVNIVSATGEVNLNQNVLISKDLSVTGNVTYDGSLTFGNAVSDTISFNAPVEFNLLPTVTSNLDLGSSSKTWQSVDVDFTYIGSDIELGSTLIQTTNSDSDLELRAAGTGRIYIPINDVVFENILTVSGTTNLKDTTVIGTVDQTGNTVQTGNLNAIGDLDLTGELSVSNVIQFDNIQIDNNEITTTDSNSDLELIAPGLGTELIFDDSVVIDQNLSANYTSTSNASVATTVSSDAFFNANIVIQDNTIRTTISNSDLELLASGTGDVYLPNNSLQLDQTLTVDGLSTLSDVNIAGLVQHTGALNQSGNVTQTGSIDLSNNLTVTADAFFTNIDFINNRIRTSDSNSDLELRAAGTGIVVINDNLVADQTLTAGVTTSTTNIVNTGTVTADIFTDYNIVISDNVIETTVSNSDLELRAAGTGRIYASNDRVDIENNLTVDGLSSFKNTNITGTLDHTGSTTQTGNIIQTGSINLSNNLTVTADAFFTNIDFINNRIRTSDSNSDLELRAAGSGVVRVPSKNVTFSQRLDVIGQTNTTTVTNTGTVTSNVFTNSDILIDDNFITTTIGNNNLILRGSGSGGPVLESLKFNNNNLFTETTNLGIVIKTDKLLYIDSKTAFKVPNGTNVQRPTANKVLGELRFSTTDNVFTGFSAANVHFGGGVYSSDRQTFIRAHPTNNTINFVTNNQKMMDVTPSGFEVNGLQVDNRLLFNGNTISALTAATSIFLTPNGTGQTVIEDIAIYQNQWINQSNSTPLTFASTGDGYVRFTGSAIAIPAGDTASQPDTPELGDLRWNIETESAEVFNGTAYQSIQGEGTGFASQDDVEDLGNLWALILG